MRFRIYSLILHTRWFSHRLAGTFRWIGLECLGLAAACALAGGNERLRREIELILEGDTE